MECQVGDWNIKHECHA